MYEGASVSDPVWADCVINLTSRMTARQVLAAVLDHSSQTLPSGLDLLHEPLGAEHGSEFGSQDLCNR